MIYIRKLRFHLHSNHKNYDTCNHLELNFPNKGRTMKTTTKILLVLIAMAIFDVIIPIPLAVLMLIYVLYQKPVWMKNLVDDVYRT